MSLFKTHDFYVEFKKIITTLQKNRKVNKHVKNYVIFFTFQRRSEKIISHLIYFLDNGFKEEAEHIIICMMRSFYVTNYWHVQI